MAMAKLHRLEAEEKKKGKLYKADLLKVGICEADANALLSFFGANPLDK